MMASSFDTTNLDGAGAYLCRPSQNDVFLLENKEDHARSIAMALASEGLSIVHLRSSEVLLNLRFPAAVMLLGSTSVEGDALRLIRNLRAQGETAAIIIISSVRSVEYRISCLKAGADDCLEQPFAMAELLARVEAARRRYAMARSTRLVSGFLELNRVERILYREGVEVGLRPREYELLEFFMVNEGIVLSRALLIERVWKADRAVQATVDVHVGSLRRKIEAGRGRLVTSVRGFGFRFGDPARDLSRTYVGRAIDAKIEIGGRFIVSCKITDLSLSNCKLRITEGIALPEVVDLLILVVDGVVQRRRLKVVSRDAHLLYGEFVIVNNVAALR